MNSLLKLDIEKASKKTKGIFIYKEHHNHTHFQKKSQVIHSELCHFAYFLFILYNLPTHALALNIKTARANKVLIRRKLNHLEMGAPSKDYFPKCIELRDLNIVHTKQEFSPSVDHLETQTYT